MTRSSSNFLKNYKKGLPTSKVNFKEAYAVNIAHGIDLILGKTIVPSIKDRDRQKMLKRKPTDYV